MKYLKTYENFDDKSDNSKSKLVNLEVDENGNEVLVVTSDEGFAEFCHENSSSLSGFFDPYLEDCEENYPPKKAYDIALEQFIDDYLLNNTDFKFVDVSKEFMMDFLYTHFS